MVRSSISLYNEIDLMLSGHAVKTDRFCHDAVLLATSLLILLGTVTKGDKVNVPLTLRTETERRR